MATVKKHVFVPYSVEQMFDLVSDVDAYPNFLPWCSDVCIEECHDTGVQARIGLSFKGIRQHFTTRNIQQRPAYIDMTLVRGPFKKMMGGWRFVAQGPQACTVYFELHYEFSNFLLQTLVGPIFDHIMHSFADAFVAQARKRYGSLSQIGDSCK